LPPIKEITENLIKYVLPEGSSPEDKEANPIAAQEIVDAIRQVS